MYRSFVGRDYINNVLIYQAWLVDYAFSLPRFPGAQLRVILSVSHRSPAMTLRVQSRDRQTSAGFSRGCLPGVAPGHKILIIFTITPPRRTLDNTAFIPS